MLDRDSPFYNDEDRFICDKDFDYSEFRDEFASKPSVEINNITQYFHDGRCLNDDLHLAAHIYI